MLHIVFFLDKKTKVIYFLGHKADKTPDFCTLKRRMINGLILQPDGYFHLFATTHSTVAKVQEES